MAPAAPRYTENSNNIYHTENSDNIYHLNLSGIINLIENKAILEEGTQVSGHT